MAEVAFVSTVPSHPGMKDAVDSGTIYLLSALIWLQGVLSVMLIGTLLEVCLAALMAVLWWLQANSDFPGVSVRAASCLRAWYFSGMC